MNEFGSFQANDGDTWPPDVPDGFTVHKVCPTCEPVRYAQLIATPEDAWTFHTPGLVSLLFDRVTVDGTDLPCGLACGVCAGSPGWVETWVGVDCWCGDVISYIVTGNVEIEYRNTPWRDEQNAA